MPNDAPDPELEDLDRILDGLLAGNPARHQRYAGDGPDPRPLADVAELVRLATMVAPAPATRARHVHLLMAQARGWGMPARAARWARHRRHRLVAAGTLAGALLAVAPVTVALAAQAQPGQALYGTKLFIERVELATQRDPASRVSLQMQFAADRVSEIGSLLHSGHTRPLAGVEAALIAQQAEAQAGLSRLQAEGKAPPALVAQVWVFAQAHSDRLGTLALQTGCHEDAQDGPDCPGLISARDASEDLVHTLALGRGQGDGGQGDGGQGQVGQAGVQASGGSADGASGATSAGSTGSGPQSRGSGSAATRSGTSDRSGSSDAGRSAAGDTLSTPSGPQAGSSNLSGVSGSTDGSRTGGSATPVPTRTGDGGSDGEHSGSPSPSPSPTRSGDGGGTDGGR